MAKGVKKVQEIVVAEPEQEIERRVNAPRPQPESLPQVIERLRKKALTDRWIDPHLDKLAAEDLPCVYYRLLYYLAQELRPAVMVELGTGTGRAAAHMAAGSPQGRLYCVDPEEHGSWKLSTAPYRNITFIHARATEPETLAYFREGEVGLCFVDDVHAGDHVIREVALWTPKVKNGGVFLFDDLKLGQGMENVLPSLAFKEKGELDGMHGPFGFGYAVVRK